MIQNVINNKKCGQCVYCTNGKCGALNIEINPAKDTCPFFNAGTNKCSVCGKIINSNEEVLIYGNEPKIYCADCFHKIGTCVTCIDIKHCAFHEDQTTPDVIMKQMRQGNMMVQAQVKNPDKIQIHCIEGNCKCFDKITNSCMRETIQTCAAWNNPSFNAEAPSETL